MTINNTNQSVFSLLDSYIDSVAIEKSAAVKAATDPASALATPSDAAANLVPSTEGAHGKEKTQDAKNALGGAMSDADKSEAANSDNAADGNINGGAIDADDAPELNPKAQPDDKAVFADPVSKASSVKSLGAQILAGLTATPASADIEAPAEKQAAAPAAVNYTAQVTKVATAAQADAEQYAEFLTGYLTSVREKQAMDGAGLPGSEVSPEEATSELAAAATGAGVGEEAMGATMDNGMGGGELDPEDLALLSQLEQQGVSIDDIVQLVEEANASGVDLGAEGGAPAPAMEEMAPALPEEAALPVDPAMDYEKGAALLKQAYTKLQAPVKAAAVTPESLASKMSPEEVEVAVNAVAKIEKAAKYLNVAPKDLHAAMSTYKGA